MYANCSNNASKNKKFAFCACLNFSNCVTHLNFPNGFHVITFPKKIPFHTFSAQELTATVVELNFLLYAKRDSQLIINEFSERKIYIQQSGKSFEAGFLRKCFYFTLCLLFRRQYKKKRRQHYCIDKKNIFVTFLKIFFRAYV